MKKNMGIVDRVVRMAGALVIAIVLMNNTVGPTLSWVLGIIAAILLLTSTISLCPAYLPFGISTIGKKSTFRQDG